MKPENARVRCWNSEGIWGDSTCEKLLEAIHCANCPVYSDASKELFERKIPAEYFDEWAEGVEHAHGISASTGGRLFVFGLCGRLFALPARSVSEVATMRMVHGIPFRRDASVAGIANINGELVLTVDLANLFSLPECGEKRKCIVVCASSSDRFAFTADFAKGAASPDAASLSDADPSDPWYVGKKFKCGGEDAVLIDFEILLGAITKRKL